MSERTLSTEKVAELTKKWGERSKEWEAVLPTTRDLHDLASDVFDIRSTFGLTSFLDNTPISTQKTLLTISRRRFDQQATIRITVAQNTSEADVQEVFELIKPAYGHPETIIRRGATYVSPATGIRVDPIQPYMNERQLAPYERLAFAKLIWEAHLQSNAPMTDVLNTPPNPQA